ncbi:hypothetical protein BH23PLA1_BH23PLA1_35900 [soil metagenome]
MGIDSETIIKAPAKVLACLRPGYVTAAIGAGLGLADGGIPTEIPMHLLPMDLRMPNAEFTVLLDRRTGEIRTIERAVVR